MLIEQVDQLLSVWVRDLAAIEANILELNGLLSYQVLSEGTPRFTGRSSTEIPQALTAVEALWESLHLLRDLLAKAKSLRDNLPLLKRAQALTEIGQLLTGPSLLLPASVIPLERRGLLSGSESTSRVSPEQLKRQMVQQFDKARAVFTTIDKKWADWQRAIDKHRANANDLSTQIKHCTPTEVYELTRLQSALDDLEVQLRADPLGFSDPEDFLRPFFKQARSRLADLRLEQSKRGARQDELAQHTERALRLEERAKAIGQESAAVARLRSALADFSSRARRDVSFLDTNLSELLKPFFRQAVEEVQSLEAREVGKREASGKLAAHVKRAEALTQRAAAIQLKTPALDKLNETMRALSAQLEKEPARFEDPAEFLEPFFRKAEQSIKAPAEPQDVMRVEVERARSQCEKLASLYQEARQILNATAQLRPALALPELPAEPPSINSVEEALHTGRVEEARAALSAISAVYGQSIAPLRAVINAGGALSSQVLDLRARLKKALTLMEEHGLQGDKPSKNYLQKLSQLLPEEGTIEVASLDSISLLVYSLETRLSELILSR